ncbi:MAG TPA: hypothetical protein VGK74_23170 [Symbiobacteriaceae bacterium]|jgi:hypothetical protein
MRYEIRLNGRLPRDWADWFDGFSCTLTETGETVLTGPVPDQAALLGLLGNVGRLNLTLLSVKRLD